MYQLQVNSSVPDTAMPLAMAKPPSFSPPRYAVWVNSLWFLSLVISLTCAMLATLLQQWARRYIRNAQFPRRIPEKRARMHAFFSNGVDKFHVAWVVEALPAMIHLSLFIFFTGLLVFLFNVDRTVFSVVGCWVAISSAAYAGITLLPIFWHDSPYYAPLSSTFWLLYAAIPYALFNILTFITSPRLSFWTWCGFKGLRDRYHGWILGGIGKAAEESALERLPDLDSRVVEWTVDALSEDDELEEFFESIPGFYTSDIVSDLHEHLPLGVQKKIEAISGAFLQRTLSSGSVSESVAIRRLAACLNAADMVGGSFRVAGILQSMVFWDWKNVPHAIETGCFLRQWDISHGGSVTLGVRCITACVVSCIPKHDDRWKALTLDHLSVSDGVLEDYLAHGDSVLLANLVDFLRMICQPNRPHWAPLLVLSSLSNFDVQNTLPGLQHDFCVLWNGMVTEARYSGVQSYPVRVLLCTRQVYTALHIGTSAAPTAFSDSTFDFAEIMFHPSSYPLCNVPSHLSGLVPHGHDSEA